MNTVALESNTTLRPPWLNVARVAWIVLSLGALIVFAIGTFNQLQGPLPNCTTPGAECGPWSISQEDIQLGQQLGMSGQLLFLIATAVLWVPRLGYIFVAGIIFWRKSDDWMALALSLLLTLGITEGITDVGVLLPLQSTVYALSIALFVLLPFVFPNGRFVPRWMRWLVLPIWLTWLASMVWTQLLGLVSLMWFVPAAYAVVHRYRRVFNAVERQQTKWVTGGLLSSFVAFVPILFSSFVFPPTQPTPDRLAFMFLVYVPVYVGVSLLVPICIGVAIFRYRMWDIDVIVRKTLVYSALTGALALTYFGSVIILQGLFTAITSQQSPVVVVLSTLAIAALFFPLRNWVQDFIDRRFYRKKYDAAKVIADFGAACRDETDLDKLTARLIEVVDETMQPENVSLWLKPTGERDRQRTTADGGQKGEHA